MLIGDVLLFSTVFIVMFEIGRMVFAMAECDKDCQKVSKLEKTVESEHRLRMSAEEKAMMYKLDLRRWKQMHNVDQMCYWMTTEDGEVLAECRNWHEVEGVEFRPGGYLPKDWEHCPYCGRKINGM